LRRAISKRERAIIVMPNALTLGFAQWRMTNDPFLFDVKLAADYVALCVRLEAIRNDAETGNRQTHPRVIFFEPHLDTLLFVLGQAKPFESISIVSNHAGAEQLSRKLRIIVDLAGTIPFVDVLLPIVTELQKAASTHLSDIGDLNTEVRPMRNPLADYSDRYAAAGGGQFRILSLSSGARIQVYDGSEIPVFEEDVAHPWSKLPARTIRAGEDSRPQNPAIDPEKGTTRCDA